MNDQQRAAMQMALEALDCRYNDNRVNAAITALREALAQPQDNLNCKSVQARLATSWGYVKAQPQGEPVAWMNTKYATLHLNNEEAYEEYYLCKAYEAGELVPLYTTPPSVEAWIDPNDKTQARYLPHIGEPVLFCHDGVTYYGKHTGGSFRTGVGVTARDFDTWGCYWMYPPAAAIRSMK